ncbi:MAG TPA: terminase small subunit [Urbifossiella sp.]|nr:terminase small subunit [Urbifossiella sp.]
MTGLTPKQEAFCLRYIETGNASEAYRLSYDAADMKPETVNRKAKELLDNGKIAARVTALQERLLKRHDTSVDRILKEYARLAFLDIRKAFDDDGNLKAIHDLDDDTAAAISGLEVEVRRVAGDADEEMEGQPHGGALKRQHGATARLHKIKLTDKKGALDSLARIRGLFVDRTEITGKDGGPIVTKEQRDAAVAAALGADS